ncbi:MAG: thioredoxin domain-containing protein [Desulfobacteraceae bacterium]
MSSPEYQIIPCPQCGTQNRIPSEKLGSSSAKCGRCGTMLLDNFDESNKAADYKLRCSNCKVRNRVPITKLNQHPKCGKCGHLIDTTDVLSNRPIMVSDTNFSDKVLNSPLPVFMYAWAPWCSGCQNVGPMIDQFAAESAGKIRVTKLNVDGNPSLASRFNIMSIPFFFIFDKGELKESMPGAMDKHAIMLKMAQYL